MDGKLLDVDFGAEKEMELELSDPTPVKRRMSLVVPPSPIAKDDEKEGEEPKKPPPILVPPPKRTATVAVVPMRSKAPPSISETDSQRPMTSSSKRLSWSSISTSKRRPIKYGSGKYAMTELVPQPSDDPEDPLNWPMWKKELNFYALIITVALVGVMKSVFVSVNSSLAINYSVSYTAVTALTGVPLIVSAFTGLASLTAARIFGRRPVYLISMVSIFIGAMWNMRVAESYSQCMAARVFQGIGWGAFDTLVLGSIHETFFEHERNVKIAIFHIVTIATTWGGPLLGGAVSQNRIGFSLQFEIINSFQAISVLLLIFGAPETMFDRSMSILQTPATSYSAKHMPMLPRGGITWQSIQEYVKTAAKPYTYSASALDISPLLQACRAMIAPTTLMLFVVSFLPFCALWGLSSSLSLLFSPMPFVLRPASIGALMAGPFVLSTASAAAFALWSRWHKAFVPKHNVAAIAAGSITAFVGLLTFGLYIDKCMSMPQNASATAWTIDGAASKSLHFPVVSFVLGLLAAGVYMLDATVRPLIKRSTQFTSSNLAVALRNTADMDAAVGIWRSLSAGVFVIALPNAVWFWDGLKSASIGISVAYLITGGAVAAAWLFWDENLRRLDGRVMGCVDLALLKRTGSFFDVD